MVQEPLGEYGALVTRPFLAAGVSYVPGDSIEADVLLKWSATTRRAIRDQGKLRFRDPPLPADPYNAEDAEGAIFPEGEVRRGPGRPKKAA